MIKVFSDGGSRGNPGKAACAFVVYDDDKEIYRKGIFLGNTTNNVAEYEGLINAAEWLVKNNLTNGVQFILDSELVVKQLNKYYKVKSENIINLYKKVTLLIEKYFKNYSFTHVPRHHNKTADKILNEVLDEN